MFTPYVINPVFNWHHGLHILWQDGIVLHNGSIVDARITCIFSRVISVLPESEASDLNLDNSYYIMIGIGEFPGSPGM